MKKSMSAVAVCLLGLGLVAALMELGFRIAHHLRAESSNSRTLDVSDPKVVRIVILGESTTAPVSSRGRRLDWPFKFEVLLNKHLQDSGDEHRVRVVNLARAGTSSPFQLAALREIATQFDPDVIISMLGINDRSIRAEERGWLLENSYLAQFLKWALIAWKCPGCYDVSFSAPDPAVPFDASPREKAAIDAGLAAFNSSPMTSKRDLELFRIRLKEIQTAYGPDQHLMNEHVAWMLWTTWLSVSSAKRGDSSFQLDLIHAAKEILLLSYEKIQLRTSSSIVLRCHIAYRLGDQKVCRDAVKDAFAKGANIRQNILSFASWLEPDEDPVLRQIFSHLGFEVYAGRSKIESIRDSYRRLGDFSVETRALWFAVQYPTGSTEGLKFFLSEGTEPDSFATLFYGKHPQSQLKSKYRDVIFVSNENFNAHVDWSNPGEYFTDWFGRSAGVNFGHTTERGTDLVVSNVLNSFIENWSVVTKVVGDRRGSEK